MPHLKLFAYGTLVTGARQPAVVELLESHLLERRPAWVRGSLHDLGPYPGAEPGLGRIRGEVLVLDSPGRCLPALDAYEDCDPRRPRRGEYRREQVWAVDSRGRRLRCWVYWLNRRPADSRRIPHGDYRRWIGKRG